MDTALTAVLSSPAHVTEQGISAECFDEIVRQHQRRVYRLIFLLARNADAADTLTQECFLRAYRNRGSFRGECSIATWLLRIAVNLAKDYGRNRRSSFWRRLVGLQEVESVADHCVALTSPLPSPERILLAREQLEAVWNATELLSPQQRAIFLLRFAEEMPLAEIAAALRLSSGAVKSQLFRAISRVKQTLKETSCS